MFDEDMDDTAMIYDLDYRVRELEAKLAEAEAKLAKINAIAKDMLRELRGTP